MILFPAEIFGRKQNHAESLGRKPLGVDGVLAGSKSLRKVSTEGKYDGQSRQKSKIIILVGLVFPCDIGRLSRFHRCLRIFHS